MKARKMPDPLGKRSLARKRKEVQKKGELPAKRPGLVRGKRGVGSTESLRQSERRNLSLTWKKIIL